MKTIICLYGGAGTGKSTACAGVYARFKENDYNAEMNREYVKEWVWEDREIKPGDQTYFFAKQAKTERRYMAKGMDVIISDSPLVLTHFYGLQYDPFEKSHNTSLKMLEQHRSITCHYGYKVEHIFLERTKVYNPAGRLQTEEEAKEYDVKIKDMLDNLGIKYETFQSSKTVSQEIYDFMIEKYT